MKRLILFALLGFFSISQDACAGGDFYWWNTTSLDWNVSSRDELVFSTKTHYNQSDHHRELTYLDFGAQHLINGWWKIGASFRVAQRLHAEGTDYEYRPQLFATYQNKIHQLNYQARLRLEQRWFKEASDHLRIQQRFFVDWPALYKNSFKPIVGEELFVKLNREGFHRARLYAGMGFYLASYCNIELFYVCQFTKRQSDWENSNVLALNLKFKL